MSFALVVTVLGMASSAKQCAITDYGASTSAADNTDAISMALAACAGGGEVTVPAGNFKTGPITVTGKGIMLNVARGATLQTAFGPEDWPKKEGSDYGIGTGAFDRARVPNEYR